MLFIIFEIYSIKLCKPKLSSWRILNTSRLITTIISICANLIEHAFYVEKYLTDDKYPYILFVSSALKVFTFIIFAVLLIMQKKRGVPTIIVPWIFLCVNVVCFIPTVSQLCLHKESLTPFEYYFNFTYFFLLLILLLISSFADLPPKNYKSFEKLEETEEDEVTRSPCPENIASFLSQLTFWWFNGMAYLGFKKPLVTEDVFDLNEQEKIEVIFPNFEKNWYSADHRSRSGSSSDEIYFSNRSLKKTILKSFWFDITIASMCLFLNCVSTLLTPVLLQYLLRFISSNDPFWHGICITFGLFTSNVVVNFASNAFNLRITKIQVKMQCCLVNLIYKKSLIISSAAKKTSTSGEVVNLMSVDVKRLIDFTPLFFYSFTTPFLLVFATWLMYNQLGYASFGGLIIVVLSIPITYICSSIANKYEVRQMKFKDERLKYLNETLNGIKVLKLYAWEPSFIKLITDIRLREMNSWKRLAYTYSIVMFQWTFAPFSIALVIFAIYAFSDGGHVLNAEKIFVTLNLIEILNLPLSMLPQIIAFAVMAHVSSKRIERYLNSPELAAYVNRRESDLAAEIVNGHFQWETSNVETLVDINLKVRMGSLHVVVGQVGSGKSSLLSALLGEMEKVRGTVNINGQLKIAYVSQQAWIENLTLRDNILFGNEYSKEKFDEIIDACALRPDLEMLPAGDLTEIGEKGINLSGGQKQRVSIARACYSDADLYLFDDPLSAVDAHVAKHIFNYILSSKRGLLKDKTRILVTNRLEILSKADFITVLKCGKISEQGTYEELMEKTDDFADFVNQYSSNKKSAKEKRALTSSPGIVDEAKELKKHNKLVEDETAEVGRVKFSVYKQYVKIISLIWSIIVIVSIGGYQLLLVAGNVWLSRWSSDNITGDVQHDTKQRNYRFEIYVLIGVLQSITMTFGNFAIIKAGIQSSIKLHSKLLNRIFRSPMSFFETTPLGRIINRFSIDMHNVDFKLPWFMKDMLYRLFEFLFAIGVIAAQTGVFILVLIPVMIAYYFIQRIYIPTSRQLQRLQSITRSPIYAHFSQTLQGVSTIRAFNANDRFIRESNKRVELNLICFYALNIAYGWLAIILNTFGSFVVLFVCFYAIYKRNAMTAGMVGLTVTYAITLTWQTLYWLVRSATLVETNIVSVERINEYCENEIESAWINDSYRPPLYWPQKGVIEFKNYSTRYRRGLDLVLRNLSASINSHEKIGIVGRTGAGKSTITLSLFRILEAVKGKIIIDDVNIADLGLHDLRSKITIIPQDPVLFSGTLRFNLDPFDAYGDEQIWEALQHSHLKHLVSGFEKGLSHEISEGGENLSVGQRQLMCLARALLRKSKILILDEATATVDLETDFLIQQTIKQEFSDCTTLTIAHRIQTILDCDRIMVIDRGTVLEFDSPSTLLSKPNSMFHLLAKNAGVL